MSEKLNEQIQNMNLEDAKIKINEAFDSLVVDGSVAIRQIPEQVFVQNFLPFFCGEKQLNDQPSVLGDWIGIAGTPMSSVNLIDKQGKVVCTVPPIMDTTIINITDRTPGESFHDIYTQYELHKAQMPVIGERVLSQAIEKKMTTVKQESTLSGDSAIKWNNIFERYGKSGSSQQKQTKNTSAQEESDIDYD